jgi:hypothetical protein
VCVCVSVCIYVSLCVYIHAYIYICNAEKRRATKTAAEESLKAVAVDAGARAEAEGSEAEGSDPSAEAERSEAEEADFERNEKRPNIEEMRRNIEVKETHDAEALAALSLGQQALASADLVGLFYVFSLFTVSVVLFYLYSNLHCLACHMCACVRAYVCVCVCVSVCLCVCVCVSVCLCV